ncbi:F-BAR domain only protein 2 isoform X3 [Lepeophtheirus salmonis]|uniref:F-BAR domain only protein 2 isoform X3 n=1 Tax=Lepeophtheirus salmonis TaxID=72036 RepID=UPI001AE658B5|nr:F-BAR domain only protein 2-like isoform X3 [Lepeophtheirus salmonis]
MRMAVDFADYFWGDKNEGFSALYQSSKSSPIAAKELGEYFRECGKVQEDHSKTQLKILKQLNGSNSTNGSFSPLLSLFKPFTEKIAGVHHEHMSKLNDLSKKTLKYAEELSKKHKTIKEETSSTSEIVKSFQDITLQLNKSKELYKQKCLELEKMKRSGEKDKDKADLKFRKAQEDYRTLVIQYCTLRETFEAKLTSYARHCQELETNHLIQMREFVQIYFTEVQQFNQQISQANEDFQSQLNKLTVTNLLEQFTMNHHTGLDKPVAESCPIEFEEEKLSVASIPGEHGGSDISDRSGNSDKLSLNSFNKKQDLSVGSNSVVTPSAQQPPPNISTGSGKNPTEMPRLRTWSVARIARKSVTSSESTTTTYNTTEAPTKTSRATSLLNLFLPNNDKNICHTPPNPLPPNSCTYNIVDSIKVNNDNRKHAGLTSKPIVTNGSLSVEITTASAPSTPTENVDLSRFLQSRGSKCGNLSSSPIPSVSSADNDQLSAHAADGSSNYETEDTSKHGHTGWTVPGFLKRRRDKKRKNEKEAPDSAPETTSNKMGSDGEDQHKSDTPTPEVDTERFSKSNDKRADLDPWAEFNESKNNFYSSSDESDDETKHKIKVEIKPVSNSNPPISASVDELRSAIGTLDIAPPPPRDIFENGTHDKHDIRRSQSQSYLVHKPSEDLLGLSLHPIGDIDNTTKIMSTTAPMSNNNIKTSDTLKMEIHDISICSSSGNASKEVGDILNETADMSANSMSLAFSSPLPTKEVVVSSVGGNATVINNQRDKVSSSLIALPRPPSRHGPQYPLPQTSSALGSSSTLTNSINSHISMGRSKNSSTSSLGNSESPHPFSNSMSNKFQFGSSRGPSPLTLGMSDNIPLAVAFQEVVHACFHGSDESQCQVRLIGDMMISFPAGIIQMITHNPMTSPLLFRIKNASVLESIVPNKQLINTATALSSDGETAFEFNMKNLKDLLKSQALQNPNASYFNIDILKYQIRAQSGAKSCPLQLVAHWKCDSSHTDLKLNYKYNASAMAAPASLLNLSIAVPIDGNVKNMVSKPSGTWIAENNRALWTFKELRADDRDNNSSSNGGLEVIKGRFELANGPGSQNTIAAQFNCEGSTLSGIDIELIGSGYRLSLIKKRFVSGKYICDAEGKQDSRFRYAFTPSNTLGSDC